MMNGAQGVLKPKDSPQSKFIITEFTDRESFTFTVNLPFAKLHVAHYFESSDTTMFVHKVWFDGIFGSLFARILGENYAKALPGVLERIQQIAESQTYETTEHQST